MLTEVFYTCVQRATLFSLVTLSHRTDESAVTLRRTDTFSDEEKKTECRAWRTVLMRIRDHSQRRHKHSIEMCEVVCGQAVRRVKEHVDSVIN